MGKLIEGFWDCPYCSQKHIGGLTQNCPTCNTPRGMDVEFYMDDPTNYINEEKAKTISKNPDWLCSFCDSLNSDNLSKCRFCGATKNESMLNYFENRQKREEHKERVNNAYTDNQFTDDTEESQTNVHDYMFQKNKETYHQTATDDFNTKPTKNGKNVFNIEDNRGKRRKNTQNVRKILSFSAIALAAILLITGLVFLFIPREENGTVESFSWERSIAIEELKTVHENAWSLPPNARLEYTRQEIKSYEQVLDHYETKTRTYTVEVLDHYETVVVGHKDNGNGTFSEITKQKPVYRTETKTETYQEPVYRQEPVYATKYYYEIDKWMHKEYVKTSGNDKTPYWGEYECGNKERKGSNSENYYIYIRNEDGESKKYSVDYPIWQKLQTGETVKLKVYITGKAELIEQKKCPNFGSGIQF